MPRPAIHRMLEIMAAASLRQPFWAGAEARRMTAAVKARASRQERRRRALIGLGAVALVVLCWFLVGEMIFAWQAARCPAAAFYADSPAALHVFTVAPLVIAATASALLAAGGISGKGW